MPKKCYYFRTHSISNVLFDIFTGSVSLAAGDYHSMILKQDGSMWTCGLNSNGQLGINSMRFTSNSLTQAIPSGATAIAAGTSHSIVLKQDDSVWATGTQINYADMHEFFFQIFKADASAADPLF